MATGTFELKVGSVADRSVSVGNWYAVNDVLLTYDASDAAIVAAISNPTPGDTYLQVIEGGVPPNPVGVSVGGSANIRFNIDTSAIVLLGDISGTFNFAGLPAGWAISSAHVIFFINGFGGIFRLTRNNSVVQTINPSNGNAIDFDLVADLEVLSVLNDIYGVEMTTTAGWTPPVTAQYESSFPNGVFIFGDWYLSYTVSSILPDPTNGPVTITGTGLDTVTDLTFQYTDADGNLQTIPITPSVQTATEIVFTLDTGTFMGTGTIFTGSVELGELTIYVATGSGIYRIVANKRNDTLYDRETGTTQDVAIPEPFGETGFIGG